VTWAGQQASSECLLGRCDALVIAATNEPFSVAMLEALQRGVPVIAADSGGALDIIDPSRNGWFFRSDDSADLARVIRERVETSSLGQMVFDAKHLVRFSAATVASQWTTIYRRLIESCLRRD
jgi:glycosyltransferase involved in cell wall biosynthesis